MAPQNTVRPGPPPILPPSTPANNARPSQLGNNGQQQDTPTSTPTTEQRMNPPPVPRSLMTPARDMREESILSSAGNSARKPRQNLDERDHIMMIKHCLEQKDTFKEGTKSQFWTGVNAAFQRDTGKILAQMSATVGRLVETRRRQIADWEHGVIPQKPGGELNDKLDEWMSFLKVEDGDAEAERMRQVDARRKVEEARKEARRQAIAAEAITSAQHPQLAQGQQPARPYAGPYPPAPGVEHPPQPAMHTPTHPRGGEMVVANGVGSEHDQSDYRPHKRKRHTERGLTRELQAQIEQQQWQAQQYALAHPPSPPRRVVVEGQLTKEDWRDIMGSDARLRALEGKVDKIELLVSQNNKLLLQLVQNQNKERERTAEEERVPVHLDAEFERDYLSGGYSSKTPLPIS